jgi:Protein of unknown function (DUF4232)
VNPTARSLRRGAFAAALALTAALGVTAASAATGPAAHRAASAPPACKTSQLRAWAGVPGDSSAGSTAFELQLSNIGQGQCSMFGYPGVSVLDAKGHQLGAPAVRDHSVTPTTVVIGRGRTAHFVLRDIDVALPCTAAKGAQIRIFPPGQTTATSVPFSLFACSNPGANYLEVRPVTPQAGIPGFSP